MKKSYLFLLLICLGNVAFAAPTGMVLSTPTTVASATICPGATDVIIYDFTLTEGSIDAGNLTDVNFTQSGNAGVPGDIVQYKLWNNTGSGGSFVVIATSTSSDFSGLSDPFATNTSQNFRITASISATPTSGRTITVNAMTASNFTNSLGSTGVSGSPVAGGSQTIAAPPAIHTFTGGGAYCAGGSEAVGLTLSDAGVSYQLYLGSTSAGTAVFGTGSAISFGNYSAAGVYHAIATSISTTCTTYLSGVTISIDPLPDTFTLTGGGSYCLNGNGVDVGLDGSASGINYQLYNNGSPVGGSTSGTGSPLDFNLQTLVGPYTVIATDATTNCTQNMVANSVAVATIPLPVVDTVTGGGNYCTGAAGVHVGLNNSTAGIIYRLYRGSTAVGTPDTSTGGAIDFGLETVAGTYTVSAHNPATGCSNNMWGSVNVGLYPQPSTYNVGPMFSAICIGGAGVQITLSGSQPGISYQVNGTGTSYPGTGSALTLGMVSTLGTYDVVATDTLTGCTRTMTGRAFILATPPVVPTVALSTNVGQGNEVCLGALDSFKAATTNGSLFALVNPPTFVWTVNGHTVGTPGSSDSSYVYVPANGDVIAVTMTSHAQCASPDTVTTSMVVVVDSPVAPSLFLDVTPLAAVPSGTPVTMHAIPTGGGLSPSYQWYINGAAIIGATNDTYTNNDYANGDSVCCSMLSSSGCGGTVTFNCVVISTYPAGITEIGHNSDVKLIPNPSTGDFIIKGTLNAPGNENVSVEITNMIGQTIYSDKVETQGGTINKHIQLGETLPNGMYILNLRSANDNNVFHFVIER